MSLVSRELFQEVEMKSSQGKEIIEIITKSYLDPSYDTKWMPAKLHLVQNKNLELSLSEKIKEFENSGCKGDEMEPKYGFLIENDIVSLLASCQTGLSIKDSEYNTIGYNCMGVYLCKHSDICLQHAIVKFSASDVIRMIVFKYVTGKKTTAITRVATVGEFIEPTPGFNSHVSVIQPICKDSLQTQFDRSQVYLYEIDKFFQPVARPRHLIPYAVIIFTVNGLVLPQLETEFVGFRFTGNATSSNTTTNNNPEIMANLKLQQAIEQINAKAPPEIFVLTKGGQVVTSSEAEVSPICVLGSKPSTNQKQGTGGLALLNSAENSQLQKVIGELNARYEMIENRGIAIANDSLVCGHASANAGLATFFGLEDIFAGMAGNSYNSATAFIGKSGRFATSLHQQGYSSFDLLSHGSNGLIHLTKPDISAIHSQSLLGAYPTVGLFQGSNQLGLLGGESTLTDLGGGVVGLQSNAYTQFQGVTLPTVAMPTVAMPTVVTGLVDHTGAAYIGPNGSTAQTATLYQQEFIPVEYLSSMVAGSGKTSGLQAAYYPIHSTPSGYALVNQGLKRPLVDSTATVSCVEKRPKIG